MFDELQKRTVDSKGWHFLREQECWNSVECTWKINQDAAHEFFCFPISRAIEFESLAVQIGNNSGVWNHIGMDFVANSYDIKNDFKDFFKT